MKQYKVLNISGAVLDKYQLEKYLEKLASDQILQEKSNANTNPIPRMKENFEFITEVYEILNEHIKLNIPIHPAGEWILDNYYVIEEIVKGIEKQLKGKKYTNFLGIANGAYKGFARIYVLASEIVAYTDAKITPDMLADLLKAYQEKKTLSMDEIWNLGIFLQIAIIENIRNICEKIYSAQIQKYKVENILERLIENKTNENLQFKNVKSYKTKNSQMKYPFIEYMSYRLKQYGKKAYPFLNILEEQVGRMGTDISEIIKKEHFDIAVKKVSMANSITSLKQLQRINFINIFEKINKVEDILKQDPAKVYDKMDYKSKIYYRNQIKQISSKTKISEIYIAKKSLELAQNKMLQNSNSRQTHIGYYLVDEGKKELLQVLQNKKRVILNETQKMKLYITFKILISFLISILLGIYVYKQTSQALFAILTTLLIYIPAEIITVQALQYILGRIVKPTFIPKLDFSKEIPEEYATFVVIPTILNDKQKVEEMMKKLETYSIANESKNIYFALLGDCKTSDKEKETVDEEVEKTGIEITKKLNKIYPNEGFPKFHFTYRKRIWNEKESAFLGWERKRGLLSQFNNYLLENIEDPFTTNTIQNAKQQGKKLPKIKYIITLDADTELVLNTGLELIGAMAHILNKPVLNKEKTKVLKGYGIMQPRVGVTLEAARKTKFTRIYAGSSGTDAYSNAISDIYQDNVKEGIFTGKGIYDLKVFSEILKNQIPENTVLSHDLLEGNYLRCAYVSDIMLMDGTPTSYQSYKTRLHRWTRGDIQIARWLKNNIKDSKDNIQKNPLNLISKYKILDNLKRSIFFPISLFTLCFILLIKQVFKTNIWPLFLVLIISIISPTIMQLISRMISRKEGEIPEKTFDKQIDGVKASIIRGVLELGQLPDKAYSLTDAFIRTIYRIKVSKNHMLEWTTAEDAEKKAKNTVQAYYKDMLPNVVLGIIGLAILPLYANEIISIVILAISVLWLSTPGIMYYISKPEKKNKPLQKLNQKEREYLLEIGKRTWQFFKDNITPENNFLPPDNYQEDRTPKIAYRTSSTNIGLRFVSSYFKL